MKILYRAGDLIDANLVKAALAEAGIESFVAGEYLTGAVGPLLAWDVVTVMVADRDLERAAPIVEAIEKDLHERRDSAEAADMVPRPT